MCTLFWASVCKALVSFKLDQLVSRKRGLTASCWAGTKNLQGLYVQMSTAEQAGAWRPADAWSERLGLVSEETCTVRVSECWWTSTPVSYGECNQIRLPLLFMFMWATSVLMWVLVRVLFSLGPWVWLYAYSLFLHVSCAYWAYMLCLISSWTLGNGTPAASSHLFGWGWRNLVDHEAHGIQLSFTAIITK